MSCRIGVWCSAEIDIGWGQVAQALVVAPVVTLLDKGVDLGTQRARQVVFLEQYKVLPGLVPAFDLALCLGMGRRGADMLNGVPRAILPSPE